MLMALANLWRWAGVNYVWQWMTFDFVLEFLNNFDYGGVAKKFGKKF
jgi:hypothetical protein